MERPPGGTGHGGPSLLALPEVRGAWALLQAMDPWVLGRQMELSAIPAPPFGEGPRGRRMAELFEEVQLRDVQVDEAGNVLGWIPGMNGRSAGGTATGVPLIVSAHLDTVFPAGTDVTPRVVDDLISAPGICDDGRGLAGLLALARVLSESHLSLSFPLLFVATVGEEGPGDLRGVRHLFSAGGPVPTPIGFISLDGIGLDRIIHRGVGSTRLRVTLRGPGGHSWADFGRPNPIHTLAGMVARFQDLPLPRDPKTTLTVARWGGGKSINAIPQDAWVEVDLRSEAGHELDRLEKSFTLICQETLEGEPDQVRSTHALTRVVSEIGRRPAGATDASSPLVSAVVEATRILGEEPTLIASSTDANLPMSMGIPAITIGAGGEGGGIHTTEEWYKNKKGPEGIFRALLTLLLLD